MKAQCASFAGRRGVEDPKAFFVWLRSDPAYFHRVLAKWVVADTGWKIRWILKRKHFNVWNLHLLRHDVTPGTEAEAARNAVYSALQRCGDPCPKRDIEVSLIGGRVGVAFIFEKGVPGSLRFTEGRGIWSDEQWP